MLREKTRVLPAIITAAIAVPSGSAHAGLALEVIDHANFVVNTAIAGSNVIQNAQLIDISHQLRNADEGSTVYNIDTSTKNIDNSTTKLTEINTEINESIQFNTEINAEFNWTINNGQDVIIPIPLEMNDHLKKIKGGQSTGEFVSHFRDASSYGGSQADADFTATRFEGSRARKAANDALAHLLDMDKNAIDMDVANIKRLAEISNEAKGHGRQLQVANAIAGTQVNQLMKLRSMLMVSEEARAAEARVAADKDAQAIAVGNRMRKGLQQMKERTMQLLPAR